MKKASKYINKINLNKYMVFNKREREKIYIKMRNITIDLSKIL